MRDIATQRASRAILGWSDRLLTSQRFSADSFGYCLDFRRTMSKETLKLGLVRRERDKWEGSVGRMPKRMFPRGAWV
jgi:hypothetical protein